MKNIKCPDCNSNYVIKKGKRNTEYRTKQAYLCRSCGRKFTNTPMKNRKYPPQVIYYSLIYYNLGHTLEKTSKLVNKRFKVKTSLSTIHSWIKEFNHLCPITTIKKNAVHPHNDPLLKNTFEHEEVEYRFICHRGKAELIKEEFPDLIEYILQFGDSCPDSFFKSSERCSDPLFKVDAEFKEDRNYLCKAAEFAVKAANTNYDRHDLVEKFLLVNDKATIACEAPVWYWEKSIDRGITGHIDILQVRNGKVYIIDYKPEAKKEKKAHQQLYQYATALSFRTGIPFKDLRCAYFDRNIYREFQPGKADASLTEQEQS